MSSKPKCSVHENCSIAHQTSLKRATPASATSDNNPTNKKLKILTTPSGIALPQKHWFDPWNSSSTGHQRAENRLAGSTSWQQSRNLKLDVQYKGGLGGGKRVADTVGAGSEEFGKDGRKENGGWVKGAKGLRTGGQRSIYEAFGRTQSKSEEREESGEDDKGHAPMDDTPEEAKDEPNTQEDQDLERAIAASLRDSQAERTIDDIPPSHQADFDTTSIPTQEEDTATPKQIFTNLTFYINGSTAPLISDHRLKYLITAHGGSLSIHHARKTVTHVIIGNPHDHLVKGGGAGGALAGTKIQKEILKTRGKGVKFVGSGWIIESVKAGTRLSEARFANVKVGGAGQGSVLEKFKVGNKPGVPGTKKDNEVTDDDFDDEALGLATA